MKFRLRPSRYLAYTNARTAVAQGQGIDADDAPKIMEIVETAAGSAEVRARHIGLWNGLVSRLIDGDHLELLPQSFADEIVDLHQRGIPLALDDLGMMRDD